MFTMVPQDDLDGKKVSALGGPEDGHATSSFIEYETSRRW